MQSSEFYDFHRKYLHIVSGKGAMPLDEAKQLYLEMITGKNFNIIIILLYIKSVFSEMPEFSVLEFENLINQINNKITVLMKKLVVIKYEFSGEEYLVIISSIPCPEMKMQKIFKASDLSYFEALFKRILESDEHSIRYNAALALDSPKRRATLIANEKLLEDWIRMLYFFKIEGNIYLGPKSLAEYKNYIQLNYSDLDMCELCLNVTFKVS